jgi:chemotaxis-related protein WspD
VAEVSLDDCWNRIGVWSRQNASCPKLERVVHCRNCEIYSSAGRQMLQRPLPDDYRLEWTDRLAENSESVDTQSRSVLVFRLGDEWLGLDSRYVNEIIQMPRVHSLPHRQNTLIKGLVNIRGELKICVSIGSLLNLDKAQSSYVVDHEILERLIYVEKDGQSFVFPVSEVQGIVHYRESALQPAPGTVAKAKDNLTAGIMDWKQSRVGILDSELLFYSLAKGLR